MKKHLFVKSPTKVIVVDGTPEAAIQAAQEHDIHMPLLEED